MAKLEISPLKVPNLRNQLEGPEYQRLKSNILALLFTQMLTRFDEEKGPDGKPWESLKSDTEVLRRKKIPAKKRGKGSIKILQDNGVLRQSWTIPGYVDNESQILQNSVVMGSNVAYVRIHNEGGTIQHPGTDNGFGKGIKIPPYAIEMPQRQMDGFSTKDEAEIDELVESHLSAGGFE